MVITKNSQIESYAIHAMGEASSRSGCLKTDETEEKIIIITISSLCVLTCSLDTVFEAPGQTSLGFTVCYK